MIHVTPVLVVGSAQTLLDALAGMDRLARRRRVEV
jgi:hypothetical protein